MVNLRETQTPAGNGWGDTHPSATRTEVLRLRRKLDIHVTKSKPNSNVNGFLRSFHQNQLEALFLLPKRFCFSVVLNYDLWILFLLACDTVWWWPKGWRNIASLLVVQMNWTELVESFSEIERDSVSCSAAVESDRLRNTWWQLVHHELTSSSVTDLYFVQTYSKGRVVQSVDRINVTNQFKNVNVGCDLVVFCERMECAGASTNGNRQDSLCD